MRVLRLIKKCTFAAHENIIFSSLIYPRISARLPAASLNEKNLVMANLGWQPMTNIRALTEMM